MMGPTPLAVSDTVILWLLDEIGSFFRAYMPHSVCLGGWSQSPGLILAWIFGHGLIAYAYIRIPIRLVKTTTTPLDLLFAAFILCCAVGHMLAIANLWLGWYGIEALWALFATSPVSLWASHQIPLQHAAAEAKAAAVSARLRDTEERLNDLSDANGGFEDLLTGLRAEAATVGANMDRIRLLEQYLSEIFIESPALFLAWDTEGHLLVTRGRSIPAYEQVDQVHRGRRVQDAYAGSPVVEYVEATLRGERIHRTFSSRELGVVWDAYYWPLLVQGQLVGGAVIAWPLPKGWTGPLDAEAPI